MKGWSFLTNHGRVLLCMAHDPGVRLRDIAASVDEQYELVPAQLPGGGTVSVRAVNLGGFRAASDDDDVDDIEAKGLSRRLAGPGQSR
jgi:hypothetical protein